MEQRASAEYGTVSERFLTKLASRTQFWLNEGSHIEDVIEDVEDYVVLGPQRDFMDLARQLRAEAFIAEVRRYLETFAAPLPGLLASPTAVPALVDHSNEGATGITEDEELWVCSYCDADNSLNSESCCNCGSHVEDQM